MKEHSIDKLFANKVKDHAVEPSMSAAELFRRKLAEKQLDELFVTTLKNHELLPSVSANKQFHDKLNERKKPVGFFIGANRSYYWAAAASIVFMLGIGWWNLQSTTTDATTATTLAEVKSVLPTEGKVISEDNITTAKVVATERRVVKKGVSKTNSKTVNSKAVVNENNDTNTPIFKPMILDEPIMDRLTLAVMDGQRERTKEEQKKRKETTPEGPQFKNSVAETIIVISDVKPTEEHLSIPQLNADSQVTLAQANKVGRERMNSERSFIAKVFTEIQHLKHGEKLDVAGINKKSELAFGQANDGFIASEKQEISYRIERIKSIFAKNTTD